MVQFKFKFHLQPEGSHAEIDLRDFSTNLIHFGIKFTFKWRLALWIECSIVFLLTNRTLKLKLFNEVIFMVIWNNRLTTADFVMGPLLPLNISKKRIPSYFPFDSCYFVLGITVFLFVLFGKIFLHCFDCFPIC